MHIQMLPPSTACAHLKLSLVLSLLENRLHLRSLHHSSLDLELTAHEQLLCIGLARNELGKVLIREVECDCYRMLSVSSSLRPPRVWGILTISLLPTWSESLSNISSLLQIDMPCLLLSLCVLQVESEDGTSLLHCILLVLVA